MSLMTFQQSLIIIYFTKLAQDARQQPKTNLSIFFLPTEHLTTYFFLIETPSLASTIHDRKEDCSFPIPINAPNTHTHTHVRKMSKWYINRRTLGRRRRLKRTKIYSEKERKTWNYRNYQIDRRLKACVILFYVLSKRPKTTRTDINKIKLLFCEHIYWPKSIIMWWRRQFDNKKLVFILRVPFPTLEILARWMISGWWWCRTKRRRRRLSLRLPTRDRWCDVKSVDGSLTHHSPKCLRWQMKFNVFYPINHYHLIGRCLMRLSMLFRHSIAAPLWPN